MIQTLPIRRLVREDVFAISFVCVLMVLSCYPLLPVGLEVKSSIELFMLLGTTTTLLFQITVILHPGIVHPGITGHQHDGGEQYPT
jgi:hypothetical protein